MFAYKFLYLIVLDCKKFYGLWQIVTLKNVLIMFKNFFIYIYKYYNRTNYFYQVLIILHPKIL